MPVLDMQLKQLEEYKGSSPKPDDFDSYWKRALEEMNSMEGDIELIPANFETSFAECFDLYFTGVKGARIHAKYLRPKHREGKIPAVLQLHGYTGHCGDWSSKLGLVAQGFCVAGLDCRGQAGL